jgi:hypothetical protein
MSKRNTVDSVFNEFVYTAIFKSSYDEKRLVSKRFHKKIMTERGAKSFAEKSSKEEKEELLAQLGYDYFYVMTKRGKTLRHIKQYLPILISKKTAGEVVAEEGFYITSDKQIIRTLGLLARLTHSSSYYLDMEMVRQGYHIHKWNKRFGGSQELHYREVDETASLLCKNMMNAILNAEKSKELFGTTKNAVFILLYLYTAKGLEISEEKMKREIVGSISKVQYANAFREVLDGGLIDRIQGTLSITSSGIKIVNDFFHSVVHANNY